MSTATAEKTELRLKRLTLKNFKGIKRFEFNPEGKSVNVYGANETGKTTLGDAITYLLFDKDTRGRNPDSFGIKTLDENGQVKKAIDHEVIGDFGVFTLRKVYKEKWTKPRSKSEHVFGGHTTDYFIDDVPKSKKEYDEFVSSIMSDDLFKMLTLPDYFAETMHWTERREVLNAMAGEVDESEIIKGNKDLEEYPAILDDKSEEDRVKILKAEKKRLNDELDNIPSRIDENEGMLEEVSGVDEAKKEVAELKDKRSRFEAKISEVKSGGNVAELRVKKSELEAEKRQVVNRIEEENSRAVSDIREKISKLNDRKDDAQKAYNDCKDAYKASDRKVAEAESEVNSIEKLIDAKQAEQPEPKPEAKEDICPMCERPLEKDEEEGEDHYEKYVKEFNSQKAIDLKSLKDQLGDANEALNEARAELEEKKQAGIKADGSLSQVKDKIEKVEAELEEAKSNLTDPKESDEYLSLAEKQTEIDIQIANHEEDKASQVKALEEEVDKVNAEIAEAERVILKQEQNQKILARIEELQNMRKKSRNQLEEVEHQLYVIEQFVRARSEAITDKVNALFDNVQWRLFKEQINGGLDETAEPLYKGVPYSEGLNSAGRVQAGIEIIQVLSGYYGKSAPVILDNRESVTTLPDNDLQVISLIVSPEDKTLRVEKEESKVAVA